MKYKILAFAIIMISISFASHLPQPTGYVNDFAGVLTDPSGIENVLRMYEQNTTIEIAVVTLDSLPEDQTLFSYGVELFQEWGIGKKGEDNGMLVLMVKNGTVGNRLRIELGYEVQGYITGAEAGRILDKALPYYEQGDYQAATEIILAGLSDELVNYAPGKPVQGGDVLNKIAGIIGALPMILFFIIIIISVAMRNRCPYCIRGRLRCKNGVCVCQRCGRKVDKRGRYAPVLVGGGFGGGMGGGGGGFGGGGSGGGGAGR